MKKPTPEELEIIEAYKKVMFNFEGCPTEEDIGITNKEKKTWERRINFTARKKTTG